MQIAEIFCKRRMLAKLLSLAMITFIGVGLFAGRYLERAFPATAQITPSIGALLLIFVSYYFIRFYDLGSFSLSRRSAVKLFCIFFVILISATYAADSLTVARIERLHFIKYGSLFFLSFFSISSHCSMLKRFVIAAIFSCSLGIIDESAQYFIPDRVFDLRDILLNCIGAGLGAIYVFSLLCLTKLLPANFNKYSINRNC